MHSYSKYRVEESWSQSHGVRVVESELWSQSRLHKSDSTTPHTPNPANLSDDFTDSYSDSNVPEMVQVFTTRAAIVGVRAPTFRSTPFRPTGFGPKLYVQSYKVRLG